MLFDGYTFIGRCFVLDSNKMILIDTNKRFALPNVTYPIDKCINESVAQAISKAIIKTAGNSHDSVIKNTIQLIKAASL